MLGNSPRKAARYEALRVPACCSGVSLWCEEALLWVLARFVPGDRCSSGDPSDGSYKRLPKCVGEWLLSAATDMSNLQGCGPKLH